MDNVTVSTKYQVVIPKRIRERLGIKPGQKMQMIPYMGRIEMIPVINISEGRGFLEGLDSSIERDEDRV